MPGVRFSAEQWARAERRRIARLRAFVGLVE